MSDAPTMRDRIANRLAELARMMDGPACEKRDRAVRDELYRLAGQG